MAGAGWKAGDGAERASDGEWRLGSGCTVLAGYVHRSPSCLYNGGVGRLPARVGQIDAPGMLAGTWVVVALWVGLAAQRGVSAGPETGEDDDGIPAIAERGR